METLLIAITKANEAVVVVQRALDLYEEIKDTLSSNDKAKVEAELALLQAQYDVTHERTQRLLRTGSTK